MKPVIKVQDVSKSYRVGATQEAYGNLREVIARRARAPFARLRRGGQGADDFWALKGVSFEVQPGEVVGIVGRNGAGKSTLLKVLSRITSPTSGRVELYGRVGSLLEVGTGFHPELTGRENVFLNGAILGMARRDIEREFDEIVAFAEVERFLDTPVKHYSSGMYMRLAFAVAAHLQPEILIVDEVLAVGDAQFQKKCLGKMTDISKQGRTILFVSHNMHAISSLCDKGVFLKEGSVEYFGSSSQAVRKYFESGTSDTRVDDLTELPRASPEFGKKILLSRAYVDGASAKIPWKNSLKLVVVIEVRDAHLEQLDLGVGINDPYGMRVFTYDTVMPIELQGETQLALAVEIANPKLSPGRYSVAVGVRSLAVTLDYVADALAIEVDDVDELGVPKNVVVAPSLAGYVEVEANVSKVDAIELPSSAVAP